MIIQPTNKYIITYIYKKIRQGGKNYNELDTLKTFMCKIRIDLLIN